MSRYITIPLLLTSAATSLLSAEWPIANATHRWRLQRDAPPPGQVIANPLVGRVLAYPQSGDETEAQVLDREGKPVGTRRVWAAPGQPLEIWFDARAAGDAPSLWLGKDLKVPEWEPSAGLLMEFRDRPDGPFDTAQQIIELWQHATHVQGRTWSERIYQGADPFGPSINLLVRFSGTFIAAGSGQYDFATISDDGSVLLIDGKQVADWPGGHGPDGGQHGEHHGVVTLSAGRHRIDYAVVQGEGGFTAVVAWKPPGSKDWANMPASAFAGAASWTASQPATPQGADVAAVTWDNDSHATPASDGVDPCMCQMRLQASGPAKKVTWRFSDGETAEGGDLMHWWLAPGLRQAEVTVVPEQGALVVRRVALAVQPSWLQFDALPSEHPNAWRKALLARSFTKAPPSEVIAAVRLALSADEPPLFNFLATQLPTPPPTVAVLDPDNVLQLAFRLQGNDLRRYSEAANWLRALAETKDVPPAMQSKARLHLGGLKLHVEGDIAAAQAVWQPIAADALQDGDRRQLAIYRADALLLSGDAAAAQAAYRAIGTVVDPGDRDYVMKRRLRLELARDRLAQGHWDEAETTLREIEWETPLERSGQETGPLLMRVWLARSELALARTRGRMLTAGDDGPRTPEILLLAARVELAGNNPAGAQRLLTRLRTDHPFSEAAAAARDLISQPKATP